MREGHSRLWYKEEEGKRPWEIAEKTAREEYTLDWSQSKVFLVIIRSTFVEQNQTLQNNVIKALGYRQLNKGICSVIEPATNCYCKHIDTHEVSQCLVSAIMKNIHTTVYNKIINIEASSHWGLRAAAPIFVLWSFILPKSKQTPF